MKIYYFAVGGVGVLAKDATRRIYKREKKKKIRHPFSFFFLVKFKNNIAN